MPPLPDAEHALDEAGCVAILAEFQDDIDRAAFGALGRSAPNAALVGKPGGTTAPMEKAQDQEAVEEALLTRLVALDRGRGA